MTDYTNLGLDDQMRPVNSPATNNGSAQVNNMEFNSNNDRDAVQAYNIKTFNFSSGYGGTLTLGGTANGNGQMIVNNDSGSAVVNIDKSGIVVKNSSGVTTIDGNGVVSTANFPSEAYTYGTVQTFTGTAHVTLNNTSSTVVLSRATKYLFQFGYDGYLTENVGIDTCTSHVDLMINGTFASGITIDSGNVNGRTYSSFYFTQLTAGTHTLKLEGYLTSLSGTPSFTVRYNRFLALALGT